MMYVLLPYNEFREDTSNLIKYVILLPVFGVTRRGATPNTGKWIKLDLTSLRIPQSLSVKMQSMYRALRVCLVDLK